MKVLVEKLYYKDGRIQSISDLVLTQIKALCLDVLSEISADSVIKVTECEAFVKSDDIRYTTSAIELETNIFFDADIDSIIKVLRESVSRLHRYAVIKVSKDNLYE